VRRRPPSAVVLAAGLGTRLRPFTDSTPKCLVEVHGRSLLANSLAAFEAAGVGAATIVTGHLAGQVEKAVAALRPPFPCELVRNEAYASTGTASSLWLGLRQRVEAPGDLVVVEGDGFFEPGLLVALLAAGQGLTLAVDRPEPLVDGSFVVAAADGSVSACFHKDFRPAGFERGEGLKLANLMYVGEELVGSVFEALTAFLERRPAASLEEFLQFGLLAGGFRIGAWRATGHRWCEIDDAADLARAHRLFATLGARA
jgi:choline kinase